MIFILVLIIIKNTHTKLKHKTKTLGYLALFEISTALDDIEIQGVLWPHSILGAVLLPRSMTKLKIN